MKKHLENLGFVVGGEATLITSMAGNVIVNIKGDKVAVSRKWHKKLWFDFCFSYHIQYGRRRNSYGNFA